MREEIKDDSWIFGASWCQFLQLGASFWNEEIGWDRGFRKLRVLLYFFFCFVFLFALFFFALFFIMVKYT